MSIKKIKAALEVLNPFGNTSASVDVSSSIKSSSEYNDPILLSDIENENVISSLLVEGGFRKILPSSSNVVIDLSNLNFLKEITSASSAEDSIIFGQGKDVSSEIVSDSLTTLYLVRPDLASDSSPEDVNTLLFSKEIDSSAVSLDVETFELFKPEFDEVESSDLNTLRITAPKFDTANTDDSNIFSVSAPKFDDITPDSLAQLAYGKPLFDETDGTLSVALLKPILSKQSSTSPSDSHIFDLTKVFFSDVNALDLIGVTDGLQYQFNDTQNSSNTSASDEFVRIFNAVRDFPETINPSDINVLEVQKSINDPVVADSTQIFNFNRPIAETTTTASLAEIEYQKPVASSTAGAESTHALDFRSTESSSVVNTDDNIMLLSKDISSSVTVEDLLAFGVKFDLSPASASDDSNLSLSKEVSSELSAISSLIFSLDTNLDSSSTASSLNSMELRKPISSSSSASSAIDSMGIGKVESSIAVSSDSDIFELTKIFSSEPSVESFPEKEFVTSYQSQTGNSSDNATLNVGLVPVSVQTTSDTTSGIYQGYSEDMSYWAEVYTGGTFTV